MLRGICYILIHLPNATHFVAELYSHLGWSPKIGFPQQRVPIISTASETFWKFLLHVGAGQTDRWTECVAWAPQTGRPRNFNDSVQVWMHRQTCKYYGSLILQTRHSFCQRHHRARLITAVMYFVGHFSQRLHKIPEFWTSTRAGPIYDQIFCYMGKF